MMKQVEFDDDGQGDDLGLEFSPLSGLDDRYPIDALVDTVEKGGPTYLQINGAFGGLRACVLADLSRRLQRPIVVLTADSQDALILTDDLAVFVGQSEEDDDEGLEGPDDDVSPGQRTFDETVLLFPEFDVGPFYGASIDRKVSMQRLTTLYRLRRDRLVGGSLPRFTVASVKSASRRGVNPERLERYCRRFAIGDVLANDDLRSYFAACGYTEVTVVEDPGTFAIRGDIVDVFTPLEGHPFRLERWGDELAEIRLFDVATQRSLENRSDCEVFPVRQEFLDEPSVKAAAERIRRLNDELHEPTPVLRRIIGDLNAGLHFTGIDALLPALHDELADLFDFLPEDALVVVVDPDACVEELKTMWDKRVVEREAARADGELVYDVGAYYRSPSDFVAWVEAYSSRIDWRRIAMAPESESAWQALPRESFDFRVRHNTDIVQLRKQHLSIEQTVGELLVHLERWRELFGRICFTCRTTGQAERLVALLESLGEEAMLFPAPIDVSEAVPPPAELLEVYVANLSGGFRSEILGVCIISGGELFGQRVVTHSKKTIVEQTAVTHFRDLHVDDYVVHVDFGIGRYKGIVHLDVEGIANDFLHIEYAEGDKLYLPVYRLGRVQKYIGDGAGMRLDKLGGTRWEKTKEKVKENIRAIAGDLLALYAKREMASGIAFSPPDEFYHQFEEAFPFEETPDQERAIAEVMSDMTRKRPMDRLICGDVGFGKTEVAIRAAMKAVADGKQVAVLVPTTLLSEQHGQSFRNRMKDFGARVEVLSRFRSAKESNEIVDDTAEGKVDVLVGTHRLLSKDIRFRDLGLLIVDEEQRFGVGHKEKIKQLKANIDVLTLSATPIPRTLQMSMLGIRDLSIIATPPHDRLSVRTHVAKYGEGIIREAIMRELSRGGQVFFVHNRVATIDEMHKTLKELVPEARIAVAHGQMPEGKLEEVMFSYIRGETNVLLASSIIESGLDIPNANTIIINRADMFGLAQLYQLRGRVGRGKERAYCYLLIPGRSALPADAEKRLEVIQTYTELGSGFHVASYDLEIRGAGNLLSKDQSGHVAAVGLDLYSELLEEAINDIRGQHHEEDIEPEVNIAVEAFIPDDYIPATSLRLMFYKRFSLARGMDELYEIYGELTDRFGDPPESVRNLRDIIAIKVGLRQIKAYRLDAGYTAISVELSQSTTLNPARVVQMVNESGGRWRLTAEMKLIYALKVDESARPLKTSKELMEMLVGL
jgi:transcription-repair coupling factor (superfamily II helicase)